MVEESKVKLEILPYAEGLGRREHSEERIDLRCRGKVDQAQDPWHVWIVNVWMS